MSYRRIGLALTLVLALVRPLSAQVLNYGSITTQDAGSCATANACVTFQVPTGAMSLLFQVSGTYSGTLTFEATADNSSSPTWFSLGVTKGSDGTYATTTTGTGQFSAPGAGYLQVRVRGGSFASGTATIYLTRGYFVSRLMYPIFTAVTASTVTATSQFLAPDGSSATPAYSFTNRPSYGLYSGGAYIGVTLGGSETYEFNATGFDIYNGKLLRFAAATSPDGCLARTATKTVTFNDCAGGAATFTIDGAAGTLNVGSGGQVVIGSGVYEGTERADPSAPSANTGRLYFRDNGAGKTQLVVRFNTGAIQVIATEP